jgi:AcrR family transcriptional regulator
MADQVKGSAKAGQRERSRRTRERIVRATEEEFRAAGYHGATIAAIARRAGVAQQTVYFVFHTKAELLSNVIDAAVLGPDPVAPDESEWYRAMEAKADPVETLVAFTRGVAGVLERTAPLKATVREAANVDPDVARVHETHERMRKENYRNVIELVAAKGSLRDGIDLDTATDILLVLAGDDGYQAFRNRGWSQEQCVNYLCAILPELLLAPGAADG